MRQTMIRPAAAGAAVIAVAWIALAGTPGVAAQGRGAGPAPRPPRPGRRSPRRCAI